LLLRSIRKVLGLEILHAAAPPSDDVKLNATNSRKAFARRVAVLLLNATSFIRFINIVLEFYRCHLECSEFLKKSSDKRLVGWWVVEEREELLDSLILLRIKWRF
jgi:hypothetical protein